MTPSLNRQQELHKPQGTACHGGTTPALCWNLGHVHTMSILLKPPFSIMQQFLFIFSFMLLHGPKWFCCHFLSCFSFLFFSFLGLKKPSSISQCPVVKNPFSPFWPCGFKIGVFGHNISMFQNYTCGNNTLIHLWMFHICYDIIFRTCLRRRLCLRCDGDPM